MILNQIEASPTTMFLKKDNRPFLIAGPCSAETEEQVMTIARDLVDADVDLFRAVSEYLQFHGCLSENPVHF